MADSKVQPELIELSDDFPFTGNVSGTVADGSITDVKVSDMAASKLTGALPAISGTALTNLPTLYTKSANDPATNTNPSAVGALWVNQVSGETYVCTDATTDDNVWTNVGGGTGDVQPWKYQGSSYGYTYGATVPVQTDVQQYSFITDEDSEDIGDMKTHRATGTASSSSIHGYTSGGNSGPRTATIEKFPFAAAQGFTMTSVGNLTVARDYLSGQSTEDYGWVSGGNNGSVTNVVDRYTHVNDNTQEDWADLHTATSGGSSGHSSATHGYHCGGSPTSNQMQRYSFSSQATGEDCGDLIRAGWQQGGLSAESHGYVCGGQPGAYKDIVKFAFTSATANSNIGDLFQETFQPSASSSTTHGYIAGGDTYGGGTPIDTIQKVSFSTDGHGENVADLIRAGNYMGLGSQI